VVAWTVTWIAATALSIWLLQLRFLQATLTGLLICLLHWVAVFTHHLGHALAARGVGAPMVGVRLWGWLGESLYPPDEPALPASAHIRRALGGPLVSVLFGSLVATLALAFRSEGSVLWITAAFLAVDSLLVFGLGPLIPLGFTDGSTLLKWLPRRT
jgi:hypothetical protein